MFTLNDILFAGNENFHKYVMTPLMETIKISSRCDRSSKYKGVNIDQDEGTIKLDQSDYLKTLETIEISPERCIRRSDYLEENEMVKFRAVVGKLNLLSTQTPPEISYSVCELSKANKQTVVQDILSANKVLNSVKRKKHSISYVPLQMR